MPINDNDLPSEEATAPPSNAHGRAALLLVESLIHGLCQNATLSVAQAVEIAERAVDVQADQAHQAEDAAVAAGEATSLRQSHTLLTSIMLSLKADTRGSGGPPFLRPVS